MALAVLSGCQRDPIPGNEVGEPKIDVSIALQTKAGSPAPKVNSVRVIAFDSDGNCALNSFFLNGVGYEINEGTEGDYVNYIVNVISPLTLTISPQRVYDVYVVLNESGQTLAGTESDLSELLQALEVGENNKTTFSNYYAKGIKYAAMEATGDEPAFIMSAYQSVSIAEGSSTAPQSVEFYTSDKMSGRTMAQITIDRITSEPNPDNGTDYSSGDVPKVFILGVSIEKVPNENTWTTNDGELGHEFGHIDIEGKNAQGYYDRSWSGEVSQLVELPAKKFEYLSGKLYRTSTNKDVKTAWASSGPALFYTDTTAISGKNAEETHKKRVEALKSQYKLATENIQAIEDFKNDRNNFVYQLVNSILPGMYSSPDGISGTKYTKTAQTLSELTFGESVLTDDYWSVILGNSFYVPENITDNSETATYIKVRLAVASPELPKPTSEASASDQLAFINSLPNPTELKTGTESNTTFCLSDLDLTTNKTKVQERKNGIPQYDGKTGLPKMIDSTYTPKSLFLSNSHIVNKDDYSIEYPTTLTDKDNDVRPNDYHIYVDNFSKRTDGTGKLYFTNETTDQERPLDSVIWNIPGTTTSSDGSVVAGDIVEIKIPVNNHKFGNDYSVRRNTRYTITLHVDQSTYDDHLTKGDTIEKPFGITASVKSEKINDNED